MTSTGQSIPAVQNNDLFPVYALSTVRTIGVVCGRTLCCDADWHVIKYLSVDFNQKTALIKNCAQSVPVSWSCSAPLGR